MFKTSVCFRKSGKIKRSMKFSYNGNDIEIVNKFK